MLTWLLQFFFQGDGIAAGEEEEATYAPPLFTVSRLHSGTKTIERQNAGTISVARQFVGTVEVSQ